MLVTSKMFDGQQAISMNTSALEMKIGAVQIIKSLNMSLGTNFRAMLPLVTDTMVDLLDYRFSISLRKEVADSIQYLIGACSSKEEMMEIFGKALPKFIDHI